MNVGLLTAILFSILILFLLSGLPVGFSLAGTALILIYWLVGTDSLYLLFTTAFADWNNYILIAIPLFVLMANFLAGSGIADDLYELMYHWMGSLRGGLAMGTVIICAIFAAMSGVSAAGTVTMGVVALPSMLKRGYDKNIALGSIAAAGSLGILIPPSITMVIYSMLTGQSVAKLFIGGVIPGIMLTGIFILYIAIRTYFQPHIGPSVPKHERLPLAQRMRLIRAVIAPIVLILLVISVIYTGVATPTEASGVGAAGALVITIANKKFSWRMFKEASRGALILTAMVGWIVLGAKLFTHVYTTVGVPAFLSGMIDTLGLNKWLILIMMQIVLLFLGCFIDPMGIMMITIPVFMPLVIQFGFDPIWFGILFTVNMEIGYITPPFGFNLFYLKGVAPEGITINDIIRSIIPFVVLEMAGLALIVVFPQIALWLPYSMLGK